MIMACMLRGTRYLQLPKDNLQLEFQLKGSGVYGRQADGLVIQRGALLLLLPGSALAPSLPPTHGLRLPAPAPPHPA